MSASSIWTAWKSSKADADHFMTLAFQAWAKAFSAKHAYYSGSARWLLGEALQQMSKTQPQRTKVLHAAYTCPSVMSAIDSTGLTRVPIDVDVCSGTMNIAEIREHCDNNTLCIITGNLFGVIDPVDQILDISRQYGSFLIEDLALCVGSSYKGQLLGTWGDAALISFGISKPLTTLHGGILVSNQQLRDSSTDNFGKENESNLKVLKALLLTGALTPRFFALGYPFIKKGLNSPTYKQPKAPESWQAWQLILSHELLRQLEAEVQARFNVSQRWFEAMEASKQHVVGRLLPSSYLSRFMILEENSSRRAHLIKCSFNQGLCASSGYAGVDAWVPASTKGASLLARGLITLPCYPGVFQGRMAKFAHSILSGA